MKVKETRYYDSFTEDFAVANDQNFELPDDYEWIKEDIFSKMKSGIIYFLAIVFSLFYCPLVLHMSIKCRKKFKGIKNGCFIFGNHTQSVGDVFIPALCTLPKRIYTVVSPANYSLPVIGKILPYLGALPVTDSLSGIKKLNYAMKKRLSKNHPIVIYPEAHVWDYCTFIREFPSTSFKYPVKLSVPAFAMTTTYQKSKVFKKPKTVVYIDGPFYGEGSTLKEKTENLHEKIYSAMKQRSKQSSHQYIVYKKK